jgi:hypothetical protein
MVRLGSRPLDSAAETRGRVSARLEFRVSERRDHVSRLDHVAQPDCQREDCGNQEYLVERELKGPLHGPIIPDREQPEQVFKVD